MIFSCCFIYHNNCRSRRRAQKPGAHNARHARFALRVRLDGRSLSAQRRKVAQRGLDHVDGKENHTQRGRSLATRRAFVSARKQSERAQMDHEERNVKTTFQRRERKHKVRNDDRLGNRRRRLRRKGLLTMTGNKLLSIRRRWARKVPTIHEINVNIGRKHRLCLVENYEIRFPSLVGHVPQTGRACAGSLIHSQVRLGLTPHDVDGAVCFTPIFRYENSPIKRARQCFFRRASGKSAGEESRNKDKNESKNFFHNANFTNFTNFPIFLFPVSH